MGFLQAVRVCGLRRFTTTACCSVFASYVCVRSLACAGYVYMCMV